MEVAGIPNEDKERLFDHIFLDAETFGRWCTEGAGKGVAGGWARARE